MYTYLLLNIGSLFFPLVLSFDKKVAFYRKWGALFPSIFIVALIFIIWDVWFTEAGIWRFNPDYLIGVNLINLPLEEWLFFFTVPYACVFIYECLISYISWEWKTIYNQYICALWLVLLWGAGIIFFDRMYTAVTFLSLGTVLGIMLLKGIPAYMGRFFQAYIVHLLPFFLINGILTALPVVIYNDLENMGFRLGTIPVEDTMYSMLLLLLNIHFYEFFKGKLQIKPVSNNPQKYVQPQSNPG